MSKKVKSKKNRIYLYIKGIISYLCAAFFIVVFALYCSARVGWFLFAALTIAPVLSVLLSFYFKNHIKISIHIDSDTLNKKEKCQLSIVIENTTILPTPQILIDLDSNLNLSCENAKYLINVMPFSKEEVKTAYIANLAGGSYIGINTVKLSDYFGIISINYSLDLINPTKYKIGVTPDIPEISGEDSMLKQTMQNAYGQGESDETIDESSLVFGGFPGYEYREYVPGDPLKRINSKLSAKRDKLWVRLDEKIAISAICLVIDPVNSDTTDKSAIFAANVLETALGISNTLINRDFSVNLYIKSDDNWKVFSMVEANDVFATSKDLSGYIYASNTSMSRVPEILKNGVSVIMCTPNFDGELLSQLSELKQTGSDNIGVYIASTSEGRVL